MKRSAALAAAAMLLASTNVRAQVELEPYVGAYIPTRDLVSGGTVTIRARDALAVGGRITLMLAGPMGLEGDLLYAFSDGELKSDSGAVQRSGGTWGIDGRLVFRFAPGPITFHMGGGIAVIGLRGDAYREAREGKTSLGGVAGAGLRVRLPGGFAIRGDLDGYFYSAQLTLDGAGGEPVMGASRLQLDIVVSAGLAVRLR